MRIEIVMSERCHENQKFEDVMRLLLVNLLLVGSLVAYSQPKIKMYAEGNLFDDKLVTALRIDFLEIFG